jgi:uncharacterized protein
LRSLWRSSLESRDSSIISAAARFEPFLLFLVFYLPGYLLQSEHLSGRIFNSISFNLGYLLQALPRIALLLYIIVIRSPLSDPEEALGTAFRRYGLSRFRLSDLGWILAALLLIELILIPLSLAATALGVGGGSPGTVHWRLTNPAMLPLVFLTSMAAGYSEEFYFRSYLLTTLPKLGVGTAAAVVASTTLFALGHLYEGIFGFVGTAVIGVILSLLFLRKRNLHIIAAAHGLYNFVTLLLTLAKPPVPF